MKGKIYLFPLLLLVSAMTPVCAEILLQHIDNETDVEYNIRYNNNIYTILPKSSLTLSTPLDVQKHEILFAPSGYNAITESGPLFINYNMLYKKSLTDNEIMNALSSFIQGSMDVYFRKIIGDLTPRYAEAKKQKDLLDEKLELIEDQLVVRQQERDYAHLHHDNENKAKNDIDFYEKIIQKLTREQSKIKDELAEVNSLVRETDPDSDRNEMIRDFLTLHKKQLLHPSSLAANTIKSILINPTIIYLATGIKTNPFNMLPNAGFLALSLENANSLVTLNKEPFDSKDDTVVSATFSDKERIGLRLLNKPPIEAVLYSITQEEKNAEQKAREQNAQNQERAMQERYEQEQQKITTGEV